MAGIVQAKEGGGPNPPYGEDIFQRIVGVHWPEGMTGLPVRIFSASGLERENLDFNRVIISVWFRLTTDVMNAAANDLIQKLNAYNAAPAGTFDFRFWGMVPILTFGTSGETRYYADSGSGMQLYSSGSLTPSFFGIQCGNIPFSNPSLDASPYLILRLAGTQDGGYAKVNGSPTGYANNYPEYFLVGPPGDGHFISYSPNEPGSIAYINVTPDVWHHAFVSYEISGVTGNCWIALDGKDYPMNQYGYPGGAGPAASYGSPYGGGAMGTNEIVAGFEMFAYDPLTAMSPGFSLAQGPALGTPVTSEFSVYGNQIDLAELQVWSGLSSPFIDNVFITQQGTPKDPKTAEVWFGQKPDILLHPALSWVEGKNVGRLFSDFTKFGSPIVGILPDPMIGKP